MSIRTGLMLAAIAGGAFASVANADVIASFTYADLSGTYTPSSPATGTFTATAVAQGPGALNSAGSTSRLVAPIADATFEPGFVAGANPASFFCSVSVTVVNGTPGSEFGLGNGNVILTDANGDTLTADLNGFWTATPGGFVNFNGTMSNVFLNDNSGDGQFTGTQAGAWNMNLPGGPPYDGAIVELVLGVGNFFQSGFTNQATGVTGQVTPTPGALALLGLGGLAIGRRRR